MKSSIFAMWLKKKSGKTHCESLGTSLIACARWVLYSSCIEHQTKHHINLHPIQSVCCTTVSTWVSSFSGFQWSEQDTNKEEEEGWKGGDGRNIESFFLYLCLFYAIFLLNARI